MSSNYAEFFLMKPVVGSSLTSSSGLTARFAPIVRGSRLGDWVALLFALDFSNALIANDRYLYTVSRYNAEPVGWGDSCIRWSATVMASPRWLLPPGSASPRRQTGRWYTPCGPLWPPARTCSSWWRGSSNWTKNISGSKSRFQHGLKHKRGLKAR